MNFIIFFTLFTHTSVSSYHVTLPSMQKYYPIRWVTHIMHKVHSLFILVYFLYHLGLPMSLYICKHYEFNALLPSLLACFLLLKVKLLALNRMTFSLGLCVVQSLVVHNNDYNNQQNYKRIPRTPQLFYVIYSLQIRSHMLIIVNGLSALSLRH